MTTELEQAERHLKESGIRSARREAEHILCHFLNCRTVDLYVSDTAIKDSQRQILYEVIKRRADGEPLQYILGKTEFYGNEFKIKNGVFIPRLETEILVDVVLNKLRTASLTVRQANSKLQTNILDLCTGCGNIAISLTKASPRYKIFASDISKKAVALAEENAKINGVTEEIEFRYGNLFKPWREKGRFFNAVVCNPPYIKTGQLKGLPKDVKKEPKWALDGGRYGLKFYAQILKEAPFYLKENGFVFFEISPDILEGVKRLLQKDFGNIEIIKDYNNLDRVAVAQWINY